MQGQAGVLLLSRGGGARGSGRDHTCRGLNEQFLMDLRRGGTFDTVVRALDDVADRLERE